MDISDIVCPVTTPLGFFRELLSIFMWFWGRVSM